MDRRTAGRIGLALGVLLLVDTVRVYLPSVSNIFGVAAETSAYQLGGFAAAWFVLAFAALPLIRLVGARRTALGGAAVLALARLALQGTDGGQPQLYLACAGLLGGLIWLAATAAAGLTGRDAALAVAAGLAAATVEHAVLGTLDLMWRPGSWPWAAVAVQVAAFAVTVFRATVPHGAGGRQADTPAAVWFLVGPAIAASAIVFGSPARAETALTTSWQAGSILVAGAAVLAVPVATARWSARAATLPAVGTVLALVLAVLIRVTVDRTPGWLPAWAVAGQLLGAVCLGACLGRAGNRERESRPARRALALLGGMLVLLVVVFGYYASYDTDLGFANRWLLVALALLIAGVTATVRGSVPTRSAQSRSAQSRSARRSRAAAPVGVLTALVAVAALLAATGPGPTPRPQPLDRNTFRLVTYNIRMGIGLDGRFDIDGIARTLRAQHPDVVLLNEVDRGWLLNGGHDDLGLLARRLHMRAIFAPAADAVWGDALLTRLPVTGVRGHPLASRGAPTGAQALAVTLRLGDREVGVLSTHLQPPPDRPATRQARRVAGIAAGLADGRPVVLAGDLNAEPGSAPFRALTDRGLADGLAARRPLPTFPCDAPDQQIDQLLVRGLRADAIAVPAVGYSDHCPLAATLTIPRPTGAD